MIRFSSANELNEIWSLALDFGYGIGPDAEASFKADQPDRCFIVLQGDSKLDGFWGIVGKGFGVCEVHTCMSDRVRGASAIDAGQQALALPFITLGMSKVVSFCPADNRQSLIYAKKVGFKVDYSDSTGTWVSITFDEWFRNPRFKEDFIAMGKKFHAQLFSQLPKPLHDEDINHDLAVGVTWMLSKNHPTKAQDFFNSWGAQFGYFPLQFLGQDIKGQLIANIGTNTIIVQGLEAIHVIS